MDVDWRNNQVMYSSFKSCQPLWYSSYNGRVCDCSKWELQALAAFEDAADIVATPRLHNTFVITKRVIACKWVSPRMSYQLCVCSTIDNPLLTIKWSSFGHSPYSRGHAISNCRGALQCIRKRQWSPWSIHWCLLFSCRYGPCRISDNFFKFENKMRSTIFVWPGKVQIRESLYSVLSGYPKAHISWWCYGEGVR